jgi:dihydrodipicolinate synthase/N-acetylneuraminate lyase
MDHAPGDDHARFPRTALATVCVPWRPDGGLDDVLFREQVRRHAAAGLRHLYVFGTAGEGYAVDERRFDDVLTLFAEEVAGTGITPMVGVISLSLPTMIGRIERAMQRGYADFQIALPSWGVTTDREVRTFFHEILDRFPGARFIHYNLMRAGRLLEPDLYAGLAAAHPNLVGTKNGTSDIVRIHRLLTEAPVLRHFLTELGYPYGCTVGAPGLLMSLSGANIPAGIRFFQAGRDGHFAELLRRQAELVAILVALQQAISRSGAHMDGAAEKALHRLLDDRFPLRLLPPYTAMPEDDYQEFHRWLSTTHPYWMPNA